MDTRTNGAARRLVLLLVVATLAACGAERPGTPPAAQQPAFGTAHFRLPGYAQAVPLSYEIIDGRAVYQGDVILGEVDAQGELIGPRADAEGDLSAQGAGINAGNGHFDVRWPNGVVPYVIEGGKTGSIEAAMADWAQKTDIRFVERTDESDYVAFVRGNHGCRSVGLGRWGGRQLVESSTFAGCSTSDYVHELGHVMGLFHEHARGDRDAYVTINWEAMSGRNAHNYCKIGAYYDREAERCVFDADEPQGVDIGSYDHRSVMHYANSLIESIPPGKTMGNSELSSGDVAAINIMYPFFSGKAATSLPHSTTTKRLVADVSGDGRDDLVTFTHQTASGSARGDVYVGVRAPQNDLDGFLPYFYADQKWDGSFCLYATEVCTTGDFNGDGKHDLVTFHNGAYGGSKEVWVALSNGNDFLPSRKWTDGFCMQAQETCLTGDFNGDGRDDVITFHNGAWGGSSTVFVYPSNGSSFTYPGKPWHGDFCGAGETCTVGDVNGDGRDDVVTFLRGPDAFGANGDVYVALSNGTGFGVKQKWHKNICYNEHVCTVADISGDGRADLVTFTQTDSSWPEYGPDGVMVALSYGYTFGRSLELHESFCADQALCTAGDTNGDGKDDLVSFGPALDLLSRNVLVAESRLRNVY